MRTRLYRTTALTLAVVGAVALGAGWHASRAEAAGTTSTATESGVNETAAVQDGFTPIGDFTKLYKAVTPAVVSIDVHLKLDETAEDEGGGQNGGPADGPDNGPDAQQQMPQIPGFPPGFPFGMQGMQPQQPQAVEAKGAGFIINADGTVITNNHVVKDAKTVSVTLSDGHSYPAKIIGTDPKTDLAVLRIQAGHPLPYVELGDSSTVVPGQWVVALGNPFGLAGTVTAGIVSALGRDIGDGPYDRFIQIDAPINEGNSGGPLFDQRGQVIGINTAILTPTGGSVGIGFAIPSNEVKHVVTQLIASGKVVRGYLGVQAQQITPEIAQSMGLPTADPATDGALVAAVSPHSPAAGAGLQPGDVITKVNTNTVTSPGDLASDIANVDPGAQTALTYIRKGQPHNITVAVATLPANASADFNTGPGAQAPAQHNNAALGITLAPLTPDAQTQLHLPQGVTGAVIAAVKPNSAADQVGLQRGDVLIGVGDQDITSPTQAVAAIDQARKSGAGAVALRIVRGGEALFVGIGLGKANGGNG
jgi:serine protease Do